MFASVSTSSDSVSVAPILSELEKISLKLRHAAAQKPRPSMAMRIYAEFEMYRAHFSRHQSAQCTMHMTILAARLFFCSSADLRSMYIMM